MDFSFYACRFQFRAVDTLFFPPGKAGNIVRGALGTIFRSLVCPLDCPGARECPLRGQCAYAQLFEPTAIIPSPSGFGDWPRPFVLRAANLDGHTVSPAEFFHFDVHLFHLNEAALAYFVLSFAQLAEEGLGPGRGRAILTSVRSLDASRQTGLLIYDGTHIQFPRTPCPIKLSLQATSTPVSRLRLEFQTPTELKGNEGILNEPIFAILFKRVRDRLSDLRKFYGEGPLDLDFVGMGHRAESVRMVSCRLNHIAMKRRAGHSNESHPLGGFIGEAEYEGALAEFVPFLAAGYWTGVGRQTVWGKGVIRVVEIS
jgi:hypothetical protein